MVNKLRMEDRLCALNSDPMLPERSEEHTSELQSLMRISYAVFFLKKKRINKKNSHINPRRLAQQTIMRHRRQGMRIGNKPKQERPKQGCGNRLPRASYRHISTADKHADILYRT